MDWMTDEPEKLLRAIAAQFHGLTDQEMERCRNAAVTSGETRAYSAAVHVLNALVANRCLIHAAGQYYLADLKSR